MDAKILRYEIEEHDAAKSGGNGESRLIKNTGGIPEPEKKKEPDSTLKKPLKDVIEEAAKKCKLQKVISPPPGKTEELDFEPDPPASGNLKN